MPFHILPRHDISLFFASVVYSAQDAHVHGLCQLTIALEKQTLLVEINSPLMDIVGFEGEPRTKVQKDSIERAKTKLRRIDNVLIFEGGSCLEKNIDVTLGHDHSNEHSQIIYFSMRAKWSGGCDRIIAAANTAHLSN